MNKSEVRRDEMFRIEDGNTKVQPKAELMIVLADRMDVYTIGVYFELVAHNGMYGDSLSQRQIAKALGISIGKVNKCLTALEKSGVIEIIPSPQNKPRTPSKIVLKDVDKAWEINPEGKGYSRIWRWKL